MKRVLNIAAAVRDSRGTPYLDDALRRFIRTMRATVMADRVCPLVTVTALLDHVAGLCADGTETLPQEFRRLLERADAGTDAATVSTAAPACGNEGPPDPGPERRRRPGPNRARPVPAPAHGRPRNP
ncbi:hypothetical protein DIZ27_34840 [Streptomyces sp. NWU339]|uniref:hypothetical protein n=1 Tax=Streptomyces sp. NWU339 TaxID=2185284 RepID=UPI000D677EAE|nr:hypothetical protein [Streptomyces sp. NWU339]PWI06207.1 hypothetical protein DIZ27_34840 [Streptomyces sp. NWU339]